MTRQSVVKDFICARKESRQQQQWAGEKIIYWFFYAEKIFISHTIRRFKNRFMQCRKHVKFFLSHSLFTSATFRVFQINKDGLKCLLSDPLFTHILYIYLVYTFLVFVLKACFVLKCLYQFSILDSSVYCILIFCFSPRVKYKEDVYERTRKKEEKKWNKTKIPDK